MGHGRVALPGRARHQMKRIQHYIADLDKCTKGGALRFSMADLDFKAFCEDMRKDAEITQLYYDAKTQVERWNALRRLYKYYHDEIIERSKQNIRQMVDPYMVDWSKIFTPIEEDAWQSIRYYGLPLYPQYPVGRYFLDFASPYLKLGVEMDGKEFHNADKDHARDLDLLNQGWIIYRIPGRECYTKFKHFSTINDMRIEGEDESVIHREITNYFMNQSDGVFKALDMVYFHKQHDHPFYSYAVVSLQKHNSFGYCHAQFDI